MWSSETINSFHCMWNVNKAQLDMPWLVSSHYNRDNIVSLGRLYMLACRISESPFCTSAGSLWAAVCASRQSWPACSEWATLPHLRHSEKRSENTATPSPTSSLCAPPSATTGKHALKQTFRFPIPSAHTLMHYARSFCPSTSQLALYIPQLMYTHTFIYTPYFRTSG